MKEKLNKNLRLTVIGVFLVLASIVAFLLYKEISKPDFVEDKVSLYSYNNNANANYRVFLKPNILYNSESLGEGEAYITEYIDYISALFSYEFLGERSADLKGDYDVVAVVEGYAADKETNKTIWKKEFTLVPKTNFETKDKRLFIEKDITLRLADYNSFAKAVIDTSKINAQVKMSVLMNVNLKANTDKGPVEEKISPAIVIPLNTNYFEIAKVQAERKPGAIEVTKNIQSPLDIKSVLAYGVLLIIVVVGLLYVIFYTTGENMKDPLVKQLNQIFKRHGNRLVALNSEIVDNYEVFNKVKSIDDLVRIADELGKPIMYKYTPDYKDINHFYVFDDSCMYVFDLMESLAASKTEKNKKSNRKVDDGENISPNMDDL